MPPKKGCRSPNLKHGMTRSREYNSWASAKRRCYSETYQHRAYYKDRGITMCDDWRGSFAAFFRDMGWCPPGHSLERINNDGPYSPDNCRWATATEQQRNRRVCRYLTFNGLTLTVAEWADKIHIPRHTLYRRLDTFKWTTERTLTEPLHFRLGAGDAATAKANGIRIGTVTRRIRLGWTIDRAIRVKPDPRRKRRGVAEL